MVDYAEDMDVDLFDLEINAENATILLKRIEKFQDFYAYDRLVCDFIKFIPAEKTAELKKVGKEKFGADLTMHWFL